MDSLISRQDAIDALDCISGAEDVLRSLPSAEPRKGKWIRNDDYVCDQCVYHMIAGNADNFCPQCGSDMRGEE